MKITTIPPRSHLNMIIKRLVVLSLLAVLGVATPAYADRIVKPGGKIILTPDTELQMTYTVAGDWGGQQFVLRRSGKPVWASPLINLSIFLPRRPPPETHSNGQLQLLKNTDVDGNGRPDWLYVSPTAGYSPPSDHIPAPVSSFLAPEGYFDTGAPLDPYLCGWLAGIVVLDDLKTVYVFDYSPPANPLGHSALRVLGPERVKNIWQAKGDERELRTTSPMPPKIWKTIYDLIRQRACTTPDPDTKKLTPSAEQIKPDPPQTTFNYDWRIYLPPALKMYEAAVETYKSALKEIDEDVEKDLRPLKRDNALGLFDFASFFGAIPYDVVDPKNKYPEYTAMLNDYAYYVYVDQTNYIRNGKLPETVKGRIQELVIPYLQHVIKRDPRRVAAYLNLADAQWELPDMKQAARQTYRRYIDVLKLATPDAKPAKRAIERAA